MRLLTINRLTPTDWHRIRRRPRHPWSYPELAAFIGAVWVMLAVVVPLAVQCVAVEARIVAGHRHVAEVGR